MNGWKLTTAVAVLARTLPLKSQCELLGRILPASTQNP